ncbi:hypothetical protein BY458DRAFT_506941 [Sporodiniella umbellata]|nr:hypothetical protein BY458DRAFT_506941 [Sporodiniella umbellata]
MNYFYIINASNEYSPNWFIFSSGCTHHLFSQLSSTESKTSEITNYLILKKQTYASP